MRTIALAQSARRRRRSGRRQPAQTRVAVLHDTVEDTALTFEAVERLFGVDVRRIVEGETKVSKLPKMVRSELARRAAPQESIVSPSSKQDEQAENLRSMFVAMAEDWRIVVVKLADRLHNMRTLQYMPPHKRISIARETLEIFAPLAHRLGMWSFRSELADLSLKFLFPSEFAELEGATSTARSSSTAPPSRPRRWSSSSGSRTTRASAARAASRSPAAPRTSIRRGRSCSGGGAAWARCSTSSRCASSSTTARGGVASEEEQASLCYHVLGRVHAMWTPLPMTLKDYISSPKPNGYRSLHTTVLVGTQPLEVQIRTQAMHQVAEYGAAALRGGPP